MPAIDLTHIRSMMQDFYIHWELVNSALSPGAIILRGGYGVAQLRADYADLDAAFTAIIAADNDVQKGTFDRNATKTALNQRLKQFRAAVLAYLPGSEYAQRLPQTPPVNLGSGKYLSAHEDATVLWQMINAAPPPGFDRPLTLANGYTLVDYRADLGDLVDIFAILADFQVTSGVLRTRRDGLIAPAKLRLTQYRKAVFAAFPPGAPLILALPRYSPKYYRRKPPAPPIPVPPDDSAE